MRRRPLLTIAALSALVLATGCDKLMPAKPANYNAVDITGAAYGKALSLTDAEGRTRTLADFGGKYVVVFFGFTQCPDVCPGTLAELAQVKKALGPDGDKVQGVFITVDPDRDTAEVLKGYVTAFDPSFVALRGTPEQVAAVAKDFKVFYQKVPGKEPGSYTMDHTAGSYVFDTKGNVRLFTRYGTGADALTSDLKQLMKAG
ncbi:SCO family protein [Piscinibacter gummiphilus]|uniref:Photosynthetic protein synthase I n=1 Tax=Piscinibacter gummiphilus TaxID=946333 RepID=A0A1W6LEN8_9BURK|nr:SCO family protein [Piscinibacter gummiphilus]ARN22677.1 photosynthetic protein synthase I [Piscinibacter gummiphilus]ATU67374.1 SCO family protein [Piscinibacter gummiphilus]GLS97723.1 photosynthetic protein synthase I [Piscinibacter gummiphilus]